MIFTLWGRAKMATISLTTFLKWIFLSENVPISIEIFIEDCSQGSN